MRVLPLDGTHILDLIDIQNVAFYAMCGLPSFSINLKRFIELYAE